MPSRDAAGLAAARAHTGSKKAWWSLNGSEELLLMMMPAEWEVFSWRHGRQCWLATGTTGLILNAGAGSIEEDAGVGGRRRDSKWMRLGLHLKEEEE